VFLQHAVECPTDHPVRDCGSMISALDLLLDGGDVEQLAAQHYYGRDVDPAGAAEG
jgi:hypothetical protein